MPDEILSDFSHPWCETLSKDPTLQLVPTASRLSHPSTGENSLLADTLANPCCIRAVQTYVKRTSDMYPEQTEVYMLFSLGRGVEGVPGTGHGAIVALVLDEVMGTLAAQVFGRYNIVTARLNVEFKRRLDTPRVVLARAFLGGAKGERKVEIRGSVEDGEGIVFADGTSVFVRLQPSL